MKTNKSFGDLYPLSNEVEQLMARCANEDVPTDVFKAACALYSKTLRMESDNRFNKVELFILRLFKKR